MSNTEKNLLCNVICPVSFPDLSFGLLNPTDTEAVIGAAECLAECFAGVDAEGVHISEPMTVACNLSKDDMFEYTYSYLSNVCKQNLCYIARDNFSSNVVGALACESFNPDEEIPVLEGNLAPMNIIINYLDELDDRLVKTIENKTGNKVKKNEYIHAFMGGSRLKTKKNLFL